MAFRSLVTGSHGFIGSQLVKALKERGDDVIQWDLKVGRSLQVGCAEYKHKVDEVYHLACVNQEDAVRNEWGNLYHNALGTKFMAEYALEAGARFVYTSTASVYGNRRRNPIEVTRQPDPKSDYAVAKLAGEHFVKNSGADYTIFRLSNVYGPGQSTENPYCGVVAKFFEDALHGRPLKIIGDGSQTRDFTYVEDILPHLMNPDLKGVLNCSHGKEISINDLSFKVEDVSKCWVGAKYLPERPVD